MRYLLCIAAIAASLAAAPRGAHAAGVSNPCALLSLGEAQSITGLSLTSTPPNPLRADGGADKDTTCSYMNERDQAVSVMLHDDAAFFPGNAKNTNTEGFRRVKGIGDRAWTNAMAMAASVEVLKGGRYVSVRVTNADGLKDRGARNYADALKLAKLVAGRM
jgi:hypothetical protein